MAVELVGGAKRTRNQSFTDWILESSEGIDVGLALRYYSRLRFVHNLLPLLDASATPRVIAILAGGKERELMNDGAWNRRLACGWNLKKTSTLYIVH